MKESSGSHVLSSEPVQTGSIYSLSLDGKAHGWDEMPKLKRGSFTFPQTPPTKGWEQTWAAELKVFPMLRLFLLHGDQLQMPSPRVHRSPVSGVVEMMLLYRHHGLWTEASPSPTWRVFRVCKLETSKTAETSSSSSRSA